MSANNQKEVRMSSRTTENAPSTDEAAIIGAGRVNRRYVNGVFLALAAALLAGLVFFKHGPQSASASQSGPGGMAFDEFLTGELPGIRSVDGALSNADKIVEEFKFAPARVQVPLMELKVNPFRQGAAGAAPALASPLAAAAPSAGAAAAPSAPSTTPARGRWR